MRTSLLHLFSLAAFAVAAHAQAASSVSLYGLVDVSVGSTQAPGGASIKGADSGKMTTSYFGLKGSEDLSGGLKAQFAVESFMRADTGSAGRFDGDAFWARSAYVGLSGSAGTVALGRNTTSLFVQTLLFNAFGDSFGYSPSIRHYFTSGTTTGDTGWSDSIKYTSPRLGGVTFTGHVAAGEGGGGRNLGASALYFSGALGLAAAWQKVEKGATVADTTAWQLAGSYTVASVKLFAQFGQVDNDTTGNGYSITGLGVALSTSPSGKLLGQISQISPDTGASRRTLSLGYDHFVSKRTDLYAALMNDSIKGLSTGTSYSVGMRHRF